MVDDPAMELADAAIDAVDEAVAYEPLTEELETAPVAENDWLRAVEEALKGADDGQA